MPLIKTCKVLLILCLIFVCTSQCFAQVASENITGALNDLNNLTPEQKKEALSLVGMPDTSAFTLAKIIAWILFGSIGFIAFVYGKKQEVLKPLLVGLALMIYPYFFTTTVWLYIVGIFLCGVLYYWRD